MRVAEMDRDLAETRRAVNRTAAADLCKGRIGPDRADGCHLHLAGEDRIEPGAQWHDRIRDVLAGRILLIRQGLQGLGLFETIRAHTREALEQIAGTEALARVEALGIEKIHHVLGTEDYIPFVSRMDGLFAPEIADTLSRFASGLHFHAPIHVRRRIYFRLMAPGLAVGEDRFAAHGGILSGHGAHRDTWYGHPTNMINIWAAFSPISEKNGISLYPEAWGRSVPRDGIRISRDADVGRPLVCALDPGDMLVFSSRHLHSSVPNWSDDTRVSLSIRFTTDTPRYDHGNGWLPYEDSRLLGSSNSWVRSYRSRMTRAFLYAIPRRVGPWLRRRITRGPYHRV